MHLQTADAKICTEQTHIVTCLHILTVLLALLMPPLYLIDLPYMFCLIYWLCLELALKHTFQENTEC